jgi:hypothetical protein
MVAIQCEAWYIIIKRGLGRTAVMDIRRKCITVLLALTMTFVAVPTTLCTMETGPSGTSYTVEAASKVYYATHSKKYHRTKHCRTLARSKHIYKCSKKKAKRMGLKKCKVCW